MQNSKYQTAIFDWVENGQGNALVQATAGSGKTTTALEALNYMDSNEDKVFLAFNKKISDELQSRITSMGVSNARAATFHSEFLGQLIRKFGRVKVSNSKVYFLAQKHCDAPELKFAPSFIQKIVGFAKDAAFGVAGQPAIDDTQAWMDIIAHHDISFAGECSLETLVNIAQNVLKENNKDTSNVDFADMLYFCLLFNVDCKKYDWIIVDEAQDTNPCRRLLLSKLQKDTTRMLLVGDINQAIYGFTGCDGDSMDKLKDMFRCQELPLSICYRCGKNIVAEAQKYSPNIEAWENAEDGEVDNMSWDTFVQKLPQLNLDKSWGIICRNNAPLVSLAFTLIRSGIGCHIEGKEIGAGLITLTQKWKISDLATFSNRIAAYFDREMDKAHKSRLPALADKYDTMVILIERCQSLKKHSVADLKDLITSMFSDSADGKGANIVTLSSIHKSKGLEFDKVAVLGNTQLIPSKFATQEHQLIQENNLLFIAASRAKKYLLNVHDIPTKSGPTQPQED